LHLRRLAEIVASMSCSVLSSSFIEVLVVDDHPAVRAGLQALIDSQSDMRAVAEAFDEYTLAPALTRFEPDVVLLDYQLPGTNGIALCSRMKGRPNPPRVVIYSSFVAPAMALPARIARADALVDKAVAPRELAQAIRGVVAGEALLPEVTPETMALATELVQFDDLPILGMLTNGVTPRDVAATLNISVEELNQRTDRILEVLA
jgi:DNA-binding NarL/FixJ family response regulator